jgi:hypothetical protein
MFTGQTGADWLRLLDTQPPLTQGCPLTNSPGHGADWVLCGWLGNLEDFSLGLCGALVPGWLWDGVSTFLGLPN